MKTFRIREKNHDGLVPEPENVRTAILSNGEVVLLHEETYCLCCNGRYQHYRMSDPFDMNLYKIEWMEDEVDNE